MKLIDAHVHFCRDEYFDRIAVAAGHENNTLHLQEEYARRDIVHGVVMGNRSLSLIEHEYPDFLSYCIGLESSSFSETDLNLQADLVEKHLQRKACVGIKLYPGYNRHYIYESSFDPFYQLAMRYRKPVAVHTGLTATSDALLKYSHPLVIDEAATRYPEVSFVMCHIGNPWLVDAIAVLEKNRNVAADLSGILEGRLENIAEFFAQKKGYIEFIKMWLEYLGDYDRLLFGTDWPLANLAGYIEFADRIIPEAQREKVFFANANRIYGLGL